MSWRRKIINCVLTVGWDVILVGSAKSCDVLSKSERQSKWHFWAKHPHFYVFFNKTLKTQLVCITEIPDKFLGPFIINLGSLCETRIKFWIMNVHINNCIFQLYSLPFSIYSKHFLTFNFPFPAFILWSETTWWQTRARIFLYTILQTQLQNIDE